MKKRLAALIFLAALPLAGPAGGAGTADRRAEAEALAAELRFEEAARAFGALVEASPDDAALRIRLADCLVHADRFVEAIEQAEKAVALSAGAAGALASLGKALHRKGDFDAARERLHEGLEADPDCAECLWGLGRIQAISGDHAGAAMNFQRAAALDPENPVYLRHLASYVADRDKQKELYRGYLELPPREDERIRKNAEAWLAMLDHLGDRPLKQVDLPEAGTEVRLDELGGVSSLTVSLGPDRKARYLFDTGASGFTISERLRKKLKLPPVFAYTITGIGGSGTAETVMVLVEEVRVGQAIVRNVPAVVRDPAPGIDGLLGPTLFGGATVTIDPRRRMLRVEGKAGPGPAEDAAAAVELPFLAIGGAPFVPIRVSGVPMHAMVDTGASQAVVSPFAADQVDGLELMAPELAPPAYREIRGLTGTTAGARVARAVRLEVAGVTYEMAAHIPDPARVLVSYDLTPFSHALETEVWAILGGPQLDDFVLTIDWGRQVVRLAPVRPPRQRPG